MERLTTDKPNGMYELAHNSCFKCSDGSAKYRDFDNCVDARFFARELMVKFGFWKEDYKEIEDDESFDWAMLETLADVNIDDMDIEGLIVLFYRNLWAMADLRERLKHYEDAEEHGLLVRMESKV